MNTQVTTDVTTDEVETTEVAGAAVTQLRELINELHAASTDAEKFDRGVDSAGRRLRQVYMSVQKSCKDLRASIQETRNSRKAGTN